MLLANSQQGSSPIPGSWNAADDILAAQDGSPLRILIVEDEQLIALDLATIIEQHGGLALGTATTADAALRLARLHRPDVVLMDVRLAPGDGVAAARAILGEVGSGIVFVTGNTEPMTMQRIAEIGPWPVLMKPVLVRSLCEAIAHAYRQRSLG